ncbi:DUF3102 domain-containing protein [Roseibacillus persicicus]|nr:DUF3102 domain-containing protein [Roseibacillus persicicus]
MNLNDIPKPTPVHPLLVPTGPTSEQEDSELLHKENKARELNQTINSMAKKTVNLARDLGKLLAELKEAKPHGTWEDYTKNQLNIHPRSASTYIRIWEETKSYPSLEEYAKSEACTDLTIRGLQEHIAQKDGKKKADALKLIQQGKSKTSELASSSLTLADGSKLDTRKLDLADGLIDVETISNHFSPENPTQDSAREPGLHSRVQRVAASLLAALSQAIGNRRDREAFEVAELAISEVQFLLKNNELPALEPQT